MADQTVTALHAALRGLSARQRAISDNVANVNTPFFRARQVEFEGSLKNAISSGDNPMTSSAPTATFSNDPFGLTGNNVDLDAETVAGVETQMRYEMALRATGDHFTLLRAAIKGA